MVTIVLVPSQKGSKGQKGSIYPYLRGIPGAVSSGSGPAIGRSSHVGWMSLDVSVWFDIFPSLGLCCGPKYSASPRYPTWFCWRTLSFTVAPSSETGLDLTGLDFFCQTAVCALAVSYILGAYPSGGDAVVFWSANQRHGSVPPKRG